MARLRSALQFATSIFALSLSSLATLTRAGAQPAGSVGAVNPAATGTPPGASARSLVIGSSVVRNERLQTSPTGTLHVTFNDRTTLNLGPSTTLVIENYVYDPSSDAGTWQASLKSGLMRLVGGAISHKAGATLTTPVATIGIRGNMVIVEHKPRCGWQITSLAQGEISVRNRVSERLITRPGYTVCVASADQIIPEPTRANPAAVAQAFDATLSRSGQTGGATRPPTDAEAGRRGIGSAPLPSVSGSPLDALSPFVIQRSIGRNSAQGRQPRQVVPPPPTNPYGSN
jgi:FecR protein